MSHCINYRSEDGTYKSDKTYIVAFDNDQLIKYANANTFLLQQHKGVPMQWQVDGVDNWNKLELCQCEGGRPVEMVAAKICVCFLCEKVIPEDSEVN